MDKLRRKLSLGGKSSSGKEKKTASLVSLSPPEVTSSPSPSASRQTPEFGKIPIEKLFKLKSRKGSVPLEKELKDDSLLLDTQSDVTVETEVETEVEESDVSPIKDDVFEDANLKSSISDVSDNNVETPNEEEQISLSPMDYCDVEDESAVSISSIQVNIGPSSVPEEAENSSLEVEENLTEKGEVSNEESTETNKDIILDDDQGIQHETPSLKETSLEDVKEISLAIDEENLQDNSKDASDEDTGVKSQLRKEVSVSINNFNSQTSLRLEESVKCEGEDRNASTSNSVSAQIREIVTKHLSTEDLSDVGVIGKSENLNVLKDENKTLHHELDRMEDLLAATRAEREEIGIKYNALSERLDQLLRHQQAGQTVSDDDALKALLNQNMELRRRMEEEHRNFQKRVQTYHDGQRQQAHLVQRLQTKVIQYKQKCDNLELSVTARHKEMDESRAREVGRLDSIENHVTSVAEVTDREVDLESAMIRLESEQNRCENLIQVNSLLREQLEAASQANQSLASDVQKVTLDWQLMREELESKETEWRDEEKSFNDYFMAEHGRLLSLWRDTTKFRREFGDMKTSTERDLSKLRLDLGKLANDLKIAFMVKQQHSSSSNFSEQDQLDFGNVSGQLMNQNEIINSSMTPTELWRRIQELNLAQVDVLADRSELLSRIDDIKSTNEQLKLKITDNEKLVNTLKKNLNEMIIGKESLEKQVSTVNNLRNENRFLHKALADISNQVLKVGGFDMDRDRDDMDGHVSVNSLAGYLSALGHSTSVGGGDHWTGNVLTTSTLDSIVSTIQSLLNKRAMQIEELSAKLTSTKDQQITTQRKYEDCLEHGHKMEQEIQKLKLQVDSDLMEKADLKCEIERFKIKFNALGEEKDQFERLKQTLLTQVQDMNTEVEKLQDQLVVAQKNKEIFAEERDTFIMEIEKHKKEQEINDKTFSTIESKLISVKDELVTTKESLNKIVLTKDVLLLDKKKLEETVSQSEKRRRVLEVDLAKQKATEMSLRDIVAKLHSDTEVLEQDKTELNFIIKKLTEDKISLSAELAELQQEKTGLSEEVLRLEEDNLNLLDEKTTLKEAMIVIERTQLTIQNEADRNAHEKRELNSQLGQESRKRASIADEVVRLSNELERRMQSYDAIVREKERLIKDKSDLVVRLETMERDSRSSTEILATMRAQKNNLEMSLYEAQQTLAITESKRSKLEAEKEDANEKKQNLQLHVSQLEKDLESEKLKLDSVKTMLEKRLIQMDKEHALFIQRFKQEHKEEIDRILREKEAAKQRMEASHLDVLQRLSNDTEEASSKQESSIDNLRQQMDTMHRDFQHKLTTMEQDKEMVLTSLRIEKTKLHDQLQLLKKDLLASQTTLDKEKREALSKGELHKVTVDDLHAQLRSLKTQMEDTSTTHEKALKDVKNQIQEANQQREFAQQEVNNLRGKLHLAEESRDILKKDLMDTLRKHKDIIEKFDLLKIENSKLVREMNEEKQEKNSTEKSNEDLLSRLKCLEGEKGEMNRSLEESFQKITVMESSSVTSSKEVVHLRELLREVEKSRLELRKELQNHRRQLKTAEDGLQMKSQENQDLTNRIARDEEKEDNGRKEIYSMKQKLSDLEAETNALRKDLVNAQRQVSDKENVISLRDREFQQTLKDAQHKEHQLNEHRRRLEATLELANTTADDLKLQLSSAEGKVSALQAQLQRLESAKKEAEFKLTSVHSSLRRYIGMRAESSKALTPSRFSTLKKRSLTSSATDAIDGNMTMASGISDLNPEAIRDSLRDVMQQIQVLEQEKDESALKIANLKEQLSDVESQKRRADEQLVQAQSALSKMQQANQSSASELMNVRKTVSKHQETISRLQRVQDATKETNQTYEERIRVLETEATQYLDKLNRLQQNESRLESERDSIREALHKVEGKASRVDKIKRDIETDVQRLQLTLTDKDTECQVLTDRCDTLNRRVQEMEEKSTSLQTTIDRLNLALERSAEDESDLKGRLQNLNKSLTESTTSSWSLQEKIQQLQKALVNSENERRALQEHLENSKQISNEMKKSNLAISERVQQLRAELSNYEERCRDLEKQVRSCEKLLNEHNENDQHNLQQIQKLQQEKHALQNAVAELQRNLAQIEVEKQDFQRWHVLLEKDKSALKQTLDKVERERLLSEELVSKSSRERNRLDTSFNTIQKDNDDLQHRLRALEVQLDEQERQHSNKLLGLTMRHRQEKDNEMDRLRNAQVQAERTLELRERAHRQRVLGLEQQVQLLKDQLNQEIRKRQIYVQQSVQAGDQMKDLRHTLDESLKTVSRETSLDTLLLEHESRKLDNAMNRHLSLSTGRLPITPSSLLRRAVSTSTPLNTSKQLK